MNSQLGVGKTSRSFSGSCKQRKMGEIGIHIIAYVAEISILIYARVM